MRFEEKLNELNKIADRLESPETTLGEGIELYEKSLNIAKECLSELNASKAKIEQVKRQLDEVMKGI